MKLTQRQEELIEEYYADNAKKLNEVVNKVLKKLHFYDMEVTDFYSLANEVFITQAIPNYDSNKNFYTFLYTCLYRKFCTYVTRENRDKRTNKIIIEVEDNNGSKVKKAVKVPDVSLEQIICDNGSTYEDIIASDFNIDKDKYSDRVHNYIDSLSGIPKQIMIMVMEGEAPSDIKDKLKLTDKQYREYWKIAISYENKRILYKEEYMEDDEMSKVSTEDVAESYKNTSYSIESISKQLKKRKIRDDHILQRHSGQWKGFAKSELVSDILRGKSLTQIIISEEIKNGLRMQWLIDGKQRCTTLDDFLHDGFSISKNVKNYNIRYQTAKLDEDGNEILNEDGFTEMEIHEFDIRGKKFSQLPEELQEIFKDRQIPVLYNMNCTKKDIADDIARFNRSRPMNKAQNGWLGLDEEFAEFVDNIAKMPFFQPDFKGSSYTLSNIKSGLIRRIIVEGIMVADFIEDFSKDFEKMCEFLSDEASDSTFTNFYSLVERLSQVVNEDIADMFNAKDSFLWFALFSKFSSYESDDNKFIDFMIAFKESLHKKEINGKSFDDLCFNKETGKTRGTKDKYLILEKINILESLMKDFLHIEPEVEVETEIVVEQTENDNTEEVSQSQETESDNTSDELIKFIKMTTNKSCNDEDVDYYTDCMEDWLIAVPLDSSIRDRDNKPSMIAISVYANDHEVDDETMISWLSTYDKTHDTYFKYQSTNYDMMVKSLEEYISSKQNVA